MQVNTNPITAEIYYTENEKKEKSLCAVWVPKMTWKYIDIEGKMAASQHSPAALLRITGMKVSKLIVNEDVLCAMGKLITICEEYDRREDELKVRNQNLLMRFISPPEEPTYAKVNLSLEFLPKYFLLYFPREEIYYRSDFRIVDHHTTHIIEKFKKTKPTEVSQSTFEIIEQLVHEGIEKEVVAYHLQETRRVFLEMISEKKKLY